MKATLFNIILLISCLSANAQFTKVNGFKGGNFAEVIYSDGTLYARNQSYNYNQLFKSTDMGNSWQDISTHSWILGYESGVTGLVKVGSKLFLCNAYSTNNGASWATHPAIPFGMEKACYSNGTIYAWKWVGNERKILRSLDTFNTYTYISAPSAPQDTGFNFKNMFVTTQGVAITTKGGVSHTTDRGNTWQNIPLPLTTYELSQLELLKVSGNEIYYKIANVDSVKISQDMGITWTGVYTRQADILDITKGAGNKYYAMTLYRPVMMVDLSVSRVLNEVTGNYTTMTGNSVIYSFKQKLTYANNALFMPTEGAGIIKLDLATNTYSLANNGLSCAGITVIGGNSNVTLAFKKNHNYERSINHGTTWTVDTAAANVIHHDYNQPVTSLLNFNNKIYMGANSFGNERAFVSSDNGQTWKAIPRGLDVQLGLYPGVMGLTVHQNKVFACANNGYVYRLDNDSVWIPTGRPSGSSVTSIVSNGNTLFAATDQAPGLSGSVFKSTDNGVTWTNSAGGTSFANVLSLAYSDGKLFAGDGSVGPHMSTDNGATWQWINNGLSPQNGTLRVTMNAMQAYKSKIYAVQNFGFERDSLYKLWYYDIAAAKWFCESCSQPNLNVVTAWVSDSTIYLGTDGDGVWVKKKQQTNSVSLFEKQNDDIAVYPNPSQAPLIGFKHFENYQGAVIMVVNNLGQTLHQEPLSAPVHQMKAVNIPDGLYYIRVVKEGHTVGFSKWLKY